jgi:hypothetical protein
MGAGTAAAKKTSAIARLRTIIKLLAPRGSGVVAGERSVGWLLIRF